MLGSADMEASKAVVVVPMLEPNVNGYILNKKFIKSLLIAF